MNIYRTFHKKSGQFRGYSAGKNALEALTALESNLAKPEDFHTTKFDPRLIDDRDCVQIKPRDLEILLSKADFYRNTKTLLLDKMADFQALAK